MFLRMVLDRWINYTPSPARSMIYIWMDTLGMGHQAGVAHVHYAVNHNGHESIVWSAIQLSSCLRVFRVSRCVELQV